MHAFHAFIMYTCMHNCTSYVCMHNCVCMNVCMQYRLTAVLHRGSQFCVHSREELQHILARVSLVDDRSEVLFLCVFCMYVCMYVCKYLYVSLVHDRPEVLFLCVFCMYLCRYVRTYVCMYIRMYACTCVCAVVHAPWSRRYALCFDTRLHVRPDMHVYMHVCI